MELASGNKHHWYDIYTYKLSDSRCGFLTTAWLVLIEVLQISDTVIIDKKTYDIDTIIR